MKIVNVAIVGSGFMGITHLEAWRYVKSAKVKYVVSRSEEKRHDLAVKYGVEVTSSYEEVLKKDVVDVVDLCIPTYLHREYVEKAAEYGKDIALEKPLATREEDGLEIIRKAKVHGVKLMVLHVLRYFSEYKELRNVVREGVLGEVLHARAIRRGSYPVWAEWYSDINKSGGVTVDLAIHDVDFLMWCLGQRVEQVFCRESSIRGAFPDHAIILLKFSNGAIAHVEAGWNMPSKAAFTMEMELYGDKGMARYSNLDKPPIDITTDTEHSIHRPDTLPYSPSILPFPIDPYTNELQDFVDALINDREVPIHPEEALSALRVCLAARRSASSGEPVGL